MQRLPVIATTEEYRQSRAVEEVKVSGGSVAKTEPVSPTLSCDCTQGSDLDIRFLYSKSIIDFQSPVTYESWLVD